MILTAAAAFLLLLAVVYLLARPYLAPLPPAREISLEQLRADRERLRSQLRELDADFETGKLAREEYERLRARRLQQIEAATRAIREAEGLREAEGVAADAAAGAATDEQLERELERRIAERKRLLAELEAAACPACGTPIEPEDRFCRRCGAALATAEVKER
jgi:DNA repair exonuclease SbcCD ATPase subunit